MGEVQFTPREVWGSCPQGSILGVFLFNTTIDDLEEGCQDIRESGTAVQPNIVEDSYIDSPEEERTFLNGTTLTRQRNAGSISWTDSPVLPPGTTKKKKRRPPRRLNMTEDMRMEIPHEPNDRTEAKCISTLGELLRYIDDGFAITKINFESSYGMIIKAVLHRIKHAVQAQNIFRHLVRQAEGIGMVVNTSKTDMICVLDALAYEADVFLLDSDQNRIGCSKSLKALGMHFSNRPDPSQVQVLAIQKKIRSRYWMLRNLKKSGFTEDELVKVYKTMIRPVADYGSVVYHSSLTDQQDELLETLQNNALKCIFGPGVSGRRMREMADIQTLRKSREEMCDKFAVKLANNPLFADWFPLKTTWTSLRSGKGHEIYKESKARCGRLQNSPFYYYRRRLNGKEGKTYGKRNAEYRV